jgi:ATP-dependent protease ClpP protease subunit
MYSMMTGQTQDQIIRTETTFECARGVDYGLVDRVLDYNKQQDGQILMDLLND